MKITLVDIERYIEINPTVLMGKPVIKGTRITVELIQGRIAAGETVQDILIAYPHISREAVEAALLYKDSRPEEE
ncbi:DUF433 domain-containing protein [Chitinophaga japonensis]|uniref:DUF433 domain-containing protein n=1 Tax=Chitinophaga japonensis TaxID=104662 RepID=UPI00119CFE07|nr:DUF433 domain-containing protein [Chitinophaga japonensis]